MATHTKTIAERERLREEWPILDDADAKNLSGVHTALATIRHIYSFLVEVPKFKDEPTPVLKAARMLFDKQNPLEHSEALFLKKIAVAEMSVAQDADTPAIDILNSGFLTGHLWSRDVFHLWKLDDVGRPIGPDQSRVWQDAGKSTPERMAEESLLEYNGEMTLADFVNTRFGICEDPSTNWEWLRLASFQTFVRVHYRPAQGTHRSFRELREFTLEAQVMEFSNPSSHGGDVALVEQRYTIIAAVRLREPGSSEPDIIRTYDANGLYLQPPKDSMSIVDYTSRMGEDDHEWLLFYAKSCTSGDTSRPWEDYFKEFIPQTPQLSHNSRRLKSGWMGSVGPTAPYMTPVDAKRVPHSALAPPEAEASQIPVVPSSAEIGQVGDGPTSRCANCGKSGHTLADCVVPSLDGGDIAGCPLCNTKEHLFDECHNISWLNDEVIVRILYFRRSGKCQIRTDREVYSLFKQYLEFKRSCNHPVDGLLEQIPPVDLRDFNDGKNHHKPVESDTNITVESILAAPPPASYSHWAVWKKANKGKGNNA
ncbi:S-adenosyl-L-methionine-dependent methyltransferase [Apiospora arundinis]